MKLTFEPNKDKRKEAKDLPDNTLEKAKLFIPKILKLLDEYQVMIIPDNDWGTWGVYIDDFCFFFENDNNTISISDGHHSVGKIHIE